MQELALVINNPVEGNWLKHIDWNKDEFEREIAAAIKDYQGLAYTENQLKQAKADRASLNKIKKAIDDRRKEVKKAVTAPYDQFEKEVKEVTTMLDGAVAQIDEQVKAFEQKQMEEKKSQLETLFQSVVGDLEGKLSLQTIFDPAWLNRTTTLKKAKEGMETRIKSIRTGYDWCNNLENEERAVAITIYEQRFDLGETVAQVNAFKQRRQAEEAQKKANEEKLSKIIGENVAELTKGETEDTLPEQADESSEVMATAEMEDTEEEKIIKTISIPFNGKNLAFVMGALSSATMPKKGTITVSFLGAESQIENTLAKIRNSGIGFSKIEE